MIDFHKAVRALYSNVTIINGEKAYDEEGNEIEIDLSKVNAWVDPDAHKSKRQFEYPDITKVLGLLIVSVILSTVIDNESLPPFIEKPK